MRIYTTIYALFLFLIPFLGISQTYEHTLIEEKKWDISQSIGMGVTVHNYYVTTCDTSINSKNYFRLDEVFPLNLQYNPVLIGFVREDTTAQKVYFLDTNNLSEELIIDYTLSVGDSFNFVNYSSYLEVVHVDTLFMNGKFRKTIHFEGYGQGIPYPRFIEGMGNGFWGVNRNYSASLGAGYNHGGLEQSGFTCAYTTPIQKIHKEEQTLRTFPNPCTNSIHIELDDYKQSGTLIKEGVMYDFTGRIVKTFEIEKEKVLPLHSLIDGMYFLKVDGFKTVKIIKQNNK
jgi:hypothetical protein